MKRCVAVGKHLATVKGARGWGADVLQVLWASLWPSSVERCCYDVER